jgi:uroporphyrinogen decarboxylase
VGGANLKALTPSGGLAVLDPVVNDRITRAMNFREGDRVPIWDYIDNRGVVEHFAPGETDLLAANVKVYHGLGIDLCRGFGMSYDAYDEGTTRASEQGEVEDLVSGLTCWRVKYPIRSLEDLRAYQPEPPDRERIRDEWVPTIRARQQAFAPHTMYVPGAGCGFHGTYGMMGLTLFSYALYDAWDHVARLVEANAAHGVEVARAAAEAKLGPLFFIGDDIAYKGALMFSPQVLRRTFIPALASVCRPVKEAGMKVIFHSDGDVTPIIDDMIEAGIDGLNPIEPIAGMDIAYLKRRYRGRLILVGNVDCSQVLPLGTPEKVREAARQCLRDAAPGGGHFIGSSSEITPSTPLENILTFYQTCREDGRYPIRC